MCATSVPEACLSPWRQVSYQLHLGDTIARGSETSLHDTAETRLAPRRCPVPTRLRKLGRLRSASIGLTRVSESSANFVQLWRLAATVARTPRSALAPGTNVTFHSRVRRVDRRASAGPGPAARWRCQHPALEEAAACSFHQLAQLVAISALPRGLAGSRRSQSGTRICNCFCQVSRFPTCHERRRRSRRMFHRCVQLVSQCCQLNRLRRFPASAGKRTGGFVVSLHCSRARACFAPSTAFRCSLLQVVPLFVVPG